jgi:4-hydroxy-tetrahydrodipicolinate synthase
MIPTPESITLWTALITPMLGDGTIDFDGLTKLVRAQEEAGNGLLVLGSTGEALNLNPQERESVVKHVLSLKPKSPVMVGLPGSELDATLELLKSYEAMDGIHAYLMVTPLYAKPGRHGQSAWFKTLLDTATRPCMLYNVPGRTAVAMHEDTVQDLKDHPRFFALKEASGSPEQFRRYANIVGDNVLMMSGDDALCPEFAPFNLKGLVSVASNVWPVQTARYIQKVLDGSLKHAELWKDCSNALFVASNPIPVKALMAKKQMIASPALKLPLDARDMQKLDLLEASDRHINEWFQTLN